MSSDLIRTPQSEATKVLEIFGGLGVTQADYKRVRAEPSYAQQVVTAGFRGIEVKPFRAPASISRQLEAFERFSHDVLGDKKGLGNLPSLPESFSDDHTRVLVVKPEWRCNFLMDGYGGRKWQFAENLDGAIVIDERANRPDDTYVILCRDREAGDEELKNVSALVLEEQAGSYLLPHEIILFQRLYEWETGQHLDPQTLTFCPYTRAGGFVVYVHWLPACGLCVNQYNVGNANDGWRARSARVLG